ncbi:MAG: nitroreductase [Candidatus Nomurabacteria bacterium]|nr:nitroreductase [Candidatus Nomurabacteria bacterium]
MKAEEITKALNWRYAVKTFDTERKVSDTDLHAILESGRLAPSTIGLEPWKFIVVKNPEVRAKLRAVGYDQTKITDASHLVVIAYRTDGAALPAELIARMGAAQNKTAQELDGLMQMATGAAAHADMKAQAYIPLGMMVETAALMGIDTGPMEGFDSAQVNEILGLGAKNLAAATMLAIGYRGDDAYATLPKTRRAYGEVVEVIE